MKYTTKWENTKRCITDEKPFFQKDSFFRTRIMRTSYDKKSHISNNNVYIIHMVSLSLQFDKHSFFCGW